jgi:3,4-dihydroxyphenylacetate 2,3-dioxygenase
MAQGSISMGLAVAHTPRIAHPEKAGATWHPLMAAMREAGAALRENKPDAVVLASTHWVTSFNIYADAAPRHTGILTAQECPDLITAIPYDFPGDKELATAIAAEGKALGLPAIAVDEPTHTLDYGTVVPMSYLVPNNDMPCVPLPVCLMSSIDECFALGRAVRTAIEKSGKRVAVISSSAFAHNLVRGPETWPTEEEQGLDRHLISLISDHTQAATARAIFPSFVSRAKYEMGGRAIATLLGALGDDFDGKLLGYGPSSGSGNPIIVFTRADAAQKVA